MKKLSAFFAICFATAAVASASNYHNYYPNKSHHKKKHFSRHDKRFGCVGETVKEKNGVETRYAVKVTGIIDTNRRTLSGEPVKIRVGTVAYNEESGKDVYSWNFKRTYNLPRHRIWLDANQNLKSFSLRVQDVRRNSMRLEFTDSVNANNYIFVSQRGYEIEAEGVECELLSSSPW